MRECEGLYLTIQCFRFGDTGQSYAVECAELTGGGACASNQCTQPAEGGICADGLINCLGGRVCEGETGESWGHCSAP